MAIFLGYIAPYLKSEIKLPFLNLGIEVSLNKKLEKVIEMLSFNLNTRMSLKLFKEKFEEYNDKS